MSFENVTELSAKVRVSSSRVVMESDCWQRGCGQMNNHFRPCMHCGDMAIAVCHVTSYSTFPCPRSVQLPDWQIDLIVAILNQSGPSFCKPVC